MTEPRSSETGRAERMVGNATYGATVAGWGALFLGFANALTGSWSAAGTFFVAAALAFGLLSNALLRR